MKTRKINLPNVVVRVTLFAAVLVAVACSGQDGSTQDSGSSSTKESGANPPSADIHAAVLANNKEALEQHIAAGSNLNEKDPFGGSSPLISAAIFDKPEMAKILIDAGADLNFRNNEGSTALISAAFFGRPEIVKLLLDNGADKTIKNNYGATAYESVAAPFSEVKSTYDIMGKMLEPMGLKLDYAQLEKTRPEIAAMLK